MINFVKGKVSHVGNDYVVIENGGIGYLIYVSPLTISKMPSENEEVTLFTQMQVKEDGIFLHGFTTRPELNLFNQLITVSGVGAKVGMGILSYLSPEQLISSIISEDTDTLTKCSGVGKKTAARIVLELKDKMNKSTNEVVGIELSNVGNINNNSATLAKTEALAALLSLGYSRNEATGALSGINVSEMSTEEILKLALKKMTIL